MASTSFSCTFRCCRRRSISSLCAASSWLIMACCCCNRACWNSVPALFRLRERCWGARCSSRPPLWKRASGVCCPPAAAAQLSRSSPSVNVKQLSWLLAAEELGDGAASSHGLVISAMICNNIINQTGSFLLCTCWSTGHYCTKAQPWRKPKIYVKKSYCHSWKELQCTLLTVKSLINNLYKFFSRSHLYTFYL